ncbi:MAG: C25 family cysteine peptidase [Myxococcota bacterium]
MGTGTIGVADGWLDIVDPDTATVTQVTLSAALFDPFDCAVDPTTGDVLIVDQGATGPGTGNSDGGLYRIDYDPSTGNGTVIPQVAPGTPAPDTWVGGTRIGASMPLENPRGLAVGPDGTVYVADIGDTLGGNNNNGTIYAVGYDAGAVDTIYVRGNSNLVDSPTDVDIDPRPWDEGNASDGINLVYTEWRGHLRRVPAALEGSTTSQSIDGNDPGADYDSIEVGAYGNYWIGQSAGTTTRLQRYERRTDTRSDLETAGPYQALTIDHHSGDIVVIEAGIVRELRASSPSTAKRNVYTPARTGARGVSFASPRPDGRPSANLAFPTRFAPAPAGSVTIEGPTQISANGEPEAEINVFVEVTSTTDPLRIRLFDIESTGAYDVPFNGGFDSAIIVTLFAPDNTTVLAQETIAAGGRTDLDQRVATLTCAAADLPCGTIDQPLAVRGAGVDIAGSGIGLYRLRIQLTSNDDVNGLGIAVDDFHAYSYYVPLGPLSTLSGTPSLWPLDQFRAYPHFDRGCEYTFHEFDADSNMSFEVRTGLGRVLPIAASSGNNLHEDTLVDVVDPDGTSWDLSGTSECFGTSCAIDYGMHTVGAALVPTTTVNNVVGLRAADYNGYEDASGATYPVPAPRGSTMPPVAPRPDTPAFQSAPVAYNQENFPSGSNPFLRFFFPLYEEQPNPLAASPSDATGAAVPSAPFLRHSATQLTPPGPGPTPPPGPALGATTAFLINVTVVNPDPVNAMSNVAVTIPIPDGQSELAYTAAAGTGVSCDFGVVGCNVPAVGPGRLLTPLNGGPASVITATFSQIPPASSGTISYALDVTPDDALETVYLTEGPRYRNTGALPTLSSGTTFLFPNNPAPPFAPAAIQDMGTRATYDAAWGRPESLGPLCDVFVEEGTVVPNAVELASFEALSGDRYVQLNWVTAAEYENVGFHVYRRLAGEAEFRRLNDHILLGRGTTDLSGSYALLDWTAPVDVDAEYLLEDVEIDGTTTLHGPVYARVTADGPELDIPWQSYDTFRFIGERGEWGADLPGTWVAFDEPTPGEENTGEGSAGEESGGSEAPGRLTILAEDDSGILAEIVFPAPYFETIEVAGSPATRVALVGASPNPGAGEPALPFQTFWLEGLDTTGVRVELLEDDSVVTTLPAPVARAPGAATGGAPWPAAPAEIAGSVPLGDARRLLALRVWPVRLEGSGEEVRVSDRLRVRIAFEGPLASPGGDPAARSANIAEVAARPGLKIGTQGGGPVTLRGDELIAAGLAPDVDPAFLHLFRAGTEVAVWIEGGLDRRLDPEDALHFYAETVDDRYGDEAVYFLVEGDTPGLRMPLRDAVPHAGLALLDDVAGTRRVEPQDTYLPTILNEEGDNFVGPFVFSESVFLEVPTPGANGGPASLLARLRGGTRFDADAPDHHFEVRVAGETVIDALFDDTELFEAIGSLAPGRVNGDAIQVEVAPQFDTPNPSLDLIYVDAFELVYRRTPNLVAGDGGRLAFVSETTGQLEAPADAWLWDVQDPTQPVRLTGATTATGQSFAVEAGRRYQLTQQAGAARWLVWNTPSEWSTRDHRADWIAIAHPSLLEGAERLAALRRGEGLETAVIDVEDVYDEAGGGDATPLAIRKFLARLSDHWNSAPRYVVFIGDATYDYRGFLGGAASNLVPTMLVDTTFVEAASDVSLVSFDGDAVAEIAYGRLPVRTPEELDTVVDKLEAYAAEPDTGADWHAKVLLVADDGAGDGSPAEGAEFEGTVDDFSSRLPLEFDREALRLRDWPETADPGAAANAAILAALDDGVSLAFYSGHGGPHVWADELIFGTDDLPNAAQSPSLPIVVALNCLNGFFTAPNTTSLSEAALLEPVAGAVAYLSSTTVSALPGQRDYARALAERLGRFDLRRLGDAVQDAQRAVAGVEGAEDVLRASVLIGDPATRAALPAIPIALAGPDTTTPRGQLLHLDGGASAGPAGVPLEYAWELVSGAELGVEFVRTDTPTPWILIENAGEVIVRLRVRAGGVSSAPSELVITSEPGPSGLACGEVDPSAQLTGFDALYFLLPWLCLRARRGRDSASRTSA